MKSTHDATSLEASVFDHAWCAQAVAGLDAAEADLVYRAVQWVAQPLVGGTASTGEPLNEHAAAVVLSLADMGTDAQTRASALLAMLPDDDHNSRQARNDPMRKTFGNEVVSLVQGTRALLRLGHLAAKASGQGVAGTDQKEMQRKMLLAMAADLRIVLMRLASRLQSLRWYARTKTPCPPGFARETMELYTPLANRLGIWQFKWEMEDLSFRFLRPDTYKEIASQLEEK